MCLYVFMTMFYNEVEDMKRKLLAPEKKMTLFASDDHTRFSKNSMTACKASCFLLQITALKPQR